MEPFTFTQTGGPMTVSERTPLLGPSEMPIEDVLKLEKIPVPLGEKEQKQQEKEEFQKKLMFFGSAILMAIVIIILIMYVLNTYVDKKSGYWHNKNWYPGYGYYRNPYYGYGYGYPIRRRLRRRIFWHPEDPTDELIDQSLLEKGVVLSS